MELTGNPNCIINEIGVIQKANPQFDDMLEINRGASQYSNLFDSIPGNQIDALKASMKSVKLNQCSESVVLQLITDSGRELNLDIKLYNSGDVYFMEVTCQKESSVAKYITNEKNSIDDSTMNNMFLY